MRRKRCLCCSDLDADVVAGLCPACRIVPLHPDDAKSRGVILLRFDSERWHGWRASIGGWEIPQYHTPGTPRPADRYTADRSVLGTYATRDKAIEAARDMVAMQDVQLA